MKSKIPHSFLEERKEIYNKRFGVIFHGEDNLKSLLNESLIDNSPSASQSAWTYQSFISGGGFEVNMSEVNLSDNFWEDRSPDDLLYDVGEVVSKHQGCFILVGYNANYEKDSFKVIPYTLCRVGKQDDDGYSGKIVVSPNGWGRNVRKEDVDVYDAYNPHPEVIQAQVDRDGGWENYKGQILFFKMTNKYIYPPSMIEKCENFALVEYKLGGFYKGTVDRGFEDILFIRHKEFPEEQDKRDFYDNIEALSGIESASSKLIIQDDWTDEKDDPGNFKFDTIKNHTTPEKFAHFETSSSNYIRKSFKNIPPQIIDYVAGKLGNTSGEDLVKAQSVYNALTAIDRSRLERLFKELFWNYKDNINPENNWTINQFKLLDDGTADH